MENEDELYNNLVTILNLFKNRPNHLAKYLVENSALSDVFINNILKSEKLKEIQEKLKDNNLPVYFSDISEMKEFYNSINGSLKNNKDITKELNEKMINLLKEERYEDAARLRDYMIKNNIKRN